MTDWLRNPSRLLAGCVLLVIVGFAAWLWVAGVLTSGATAKSEARLQAGQIGAAAASAADAINTVSSQGAAESGADALTLENGRVILSAPGAAAPVDPGLAAAGLRSLCRRPAYLREQRCLQFTPAR